MLSIARILFYAIKPRERLLLALCLWLVFGIWFTVARRQYQEVRTSLGNVDRQLKQQDTCLMHGPAIKTSLDRERSALDAENALSSRKLIEEIEHIAKEIETSSEVKRFNAKVGRPESIEGSIFTINKIRVTVLDARLEDLCRFDTLIQQRAPYMYLDKASITGNRTDYRLHNAVFEVASFELKQSSTETKPSSTPSAATAKTTAHR